MVLDDLVAMLCRKGDLDSAEKYSRSNYKSLNDKKDTLQGSDLQILADSATRLATVLGELKYSVPRPVNEKRLRAFLFFRCECVVKKGNFKDAEPYAEQSLSLRDNADASTVSPLGIAYTLTHLCGIREQLHKIGNRNDPFP